MIRMSGNAPTRGPSIAPRRSMRDRLLRFLYRELAAGRDDLDELHSLPVEERVERGYCIDKLRFLAWEKEGARLLLACPENTSRFRAGEPLTLGYGEEPLAGVGVNYVAYDPAAGQLRVDRDPWRREGWDGLDLKRSLTLDQVPSDFIKIAIEAVETVYSTRDERSLRIRSILDRTVERTVDAAAQAAATAHLDRLPLDESQKEAFAGCFAGGPFHLVQGPPGSGKTWLIAHLVAAWVRSGERILVTAQTHRAVNNVLAKIAELDPGVAIVKAGDAHNADDLPASIGRAPSFSRIGPPPRGTGQAVGATVFALRRAWGEAPFDRVVFDEAAQILVPLAVCGMLAGRRYVFVGDHRQLGPIVSGEHEDEIAGLSIFEHLVGVEPGTELGVRGAAGTASAEGGAVSIDPPGAAVSIDPPGAAASPGATPAYPATLLRRTYRMNEGINAFPSRSFYGGELKAGAQAAARRFGLIPGGPLDDLLAPAFPAVIAALAHEGCRTRSIPEALLVADLVEDLLVRQRMKPADLAVLTPYRAQIRAIRTLVETRLHGPGSGLLIDTVERMQGQEREVVIVSLACSEPEYAAREAAFLFSPNRLNVMLTRARTKLVIVASPHLFKALPHDLEQLRNASLFARLWRTVPRVDVTGRYIGSGRAPDGGE